MILDDIFRYLRWRKAIKIIRELSKNPTVCDIGCGVTGGLLRKTSNFINLGFGFDKETKPYKNSKIELRKIDFENEKLPLKDNTIDIVIMLAVLEHLKKPENILVEVVRILKPGGLFILTTPSPKAKFILDLLASSKLIEKETISEHKKYYSLKELENLFLNTGFQRENINLQYFEFGFNILAIIKK
jgi:ubiquinone/menaquinone biosynthesis C-methylase UbiE